MVERDGASQVSPFAGTGAVPAEAPLARFPRTCFAHSLLTVLALLVVSAGCAAPNQGPDLRVKAPIAVAGEGIAWQGGPPVLPGSRVAVLEGDPKQARLFTMRIELPKGARLGAHVHPNDERVTVLSGSVHVGFGNVFDQRRGRLFKAGDYYVNPAGVAHYVWSDEGAVLQVTAVGPWGLELLGQ